MPDPFMPDVQVEIAFNAGYTTPAASRTWTDVSQYVELHEGIDITFGRQDERSTADANQLTLTLDNTDGRFTAQRTASPYYPNVKIGRPIRVRVTPPGGTASTRFVGFIDEWPVEWDSSDAFAKAKIRATSRMARLGLAATLRSTPTYSIAASSPLAYWPMGEPSGAAVALDTVNGRQMSMVLSTLPGAGTDQVGFGQGNGSPVDGLPAPTFNAGYYLRADATGLPPGSGYTLRLLVRVAAIPAVVASLISYTWQGETNFVNLLSNGQINTAGLPSVAFIADGATHDLVLRVVPGSSVDLFVDGALVSTGATSTGTINYSKPNAIEVGNGFIGTISHVAFFPSAISDVEIADQYVALLTGYAGERTDQRLARILGWANVPALEILADTGVETVTYQRTAGQSALDALREVESTEGGVLYDGRDGRVVFRNRPNRYLASAAATLNMASQHVGSDYSPKLDRSTLVNDVSVDNATTSQSARLVDGSSSGEYGIAATSVKSVADTYEALQQKASWLVSSYAEPRTRVPSLTVDVLAHQGLTPSAQTLLGVDVGSLLTLSNAPAQADTTTPSYFVEGYAERIGPQSYGITYNLSPTTPTLNVLVLDNATRGKLDTGLIAL